MLFQVAHCSCSSLQAVGATSCEHDGVYLLDGVDGVEQISFPGAWGGATYVDSGNRAGFAKNHSASRGPLLGGEMANFDATHIGQREARRADWVVVCCRKSFLFLGCGAGGHH